MTKGSCEVCLSGFVFKVGYTHYDGYKGNMYTPAESESFEIDTIEIKNYKTGKWEDAYPYIDSMKDFESAVEQYIWDDINS